MKHLTVEEMIAFVTADVPDAESTALAAKVNTHIRSCAECFDALRAFQEVYDGLVRLGGASGFADAARKLTRSVPFGEDAEAVHDGR